MAEILMDDESTKILKALDNLLEVCGGKSLSSIILGCSELYRMPGEQQSKVMEIIQKNTAASMKLAMNGISTMMANAMSGPEFQKAVKKAQEENVKPDVTEGNAQPEPEK